MNADVEALVRRLHPTIGRLVRLCINARLPVSLDAEFDHRCQGQLIVNDPDSLKAATLTLEAFGSDVTELAVVVSMSTVFDVETWKIEHGI